MAYQLKLPVNLSIYNICHINLLLSYKETEEYGPRYIRPPSDIVQGEEKYEVKYIRDKRCKGQSKKRKYLVHWTGYPASDDSWI